MKINENKRKLKMNMEQNLNSIATYKEENNADVVIDYVDEKCKECKNYSKMKFNDDSFHICNDNYFTKAGWVIMTEFLVIACKMTKVIKGEV